MKVLYDMPLTAQEKRKAIAKLNRKRKRRFQKNENISLVEIIILLILLSICSVIALFNSPTML
jgi:hypothetical protein